MKKKKSKNVNGDDQFSPNRRRRLNRGNMKFKKDENAFQIQLNKYEQAEGETPVTKMAIILTVPVD